MNLTAVSRLSDEALVSAVARMAQGEREASASLIAHLAELWARRLHERAGYASLFTYCVGVLRHSESEAYARMKAAKVARRYPEVLGLLSSGRVSLTTLRLLAPHLTRENHGELFSAAEHKTKREVQRMLAQRFPLPPVPTSVRKLPAPRVVPVQSAAALAASPVPNRTPQAEEHVHVPSTPLPLVLPLATDRFRITFTADAATCETLEMARDLLRHAIPNGDAAQVFARALEALVEDLVREKFAASDRPRVSRGQPDDSRNIPAEVQRKVYLRDRGRCAYVAPDGHRCGERAFVEFHHIDPYANRGLPTVENISLRCRAHNQYEAVDVFWNWRRTRGAGEIRMCQATHVFVPERKRVNRDTAF
jgi:hypothetical protein